MKMSSDLMLTVACVATLAVTVPATAQLDPEWTTNLSNVTMSSARLADVDGDGVKDVIIATMGPLGDATSSGSIHVFDQNGDELPGWPQIVTQPVSSPAVAVGDIDNNGDMELAVHGWQFLYVFNHDGSDFPGWPMATGTSSSASPALADLDGDGDLEIISPFDNVMHAFQHTGEEVAGWPNSAPEDFCAAGFGDVDGDGELEIVAGTSRPQFPDTVPFEIYMWSAEGDIEPGFPIGDLGSIRGPVSLGDVDADGEIEIVSRAGDMLGVWNSSGESEPGWPLEPGGPIRNADTAIGDLDFDGDLEIVISEFDLLAFHHDGTMVSGFPADLEGNMSNVNNSAIIADVDGDENSVEILVKIDDAISGFDAQGNALPNFPYMLTDDNQSGTFSPSPAVADSDNDGDIEYVFVSQSGRVAYFDESPAWNPELAFWPQAQQDVLNSCLLEEDAGTVVGDLNGDGLVDGSDLGILLGAWNSADREADLDGDGTVNGSDLGILLGNWS